MPLPLVVPSFESIDFRARTERTAIQLFFTACTDRNVIRLLFILLLMSYYSLEFQALTGHHVI